MSFTVLGGGTKDFSCMENSSLFCLLKGIFVAHPEKDTGIRIDRAQEDRISFISWTSLIH